MRSLPPLTLALELFEVLCAVRPSAAILSVRVLDHLAVRLGNRLASLRGVHLLLVFRRRQPRDSRLGRCGIKVELMVRLRRREGRSSGRVVGPEIVDIVIAEIHGIVRLGAVVLEIGDGGIAVAMVELARLEDHCHFDSIVGDPLVVSPVAVEDLKEIESDALVVAMSVVQNVAATGEISAMVGNLEAVTDLLFTKTLLHCDYVVQYVTLACRRRQKLAAWIGIWEQTKY
jgi:hypothetical protein